MLHKEDVRLEAQQLSTRHPPDLLSVTKRVQRGEPDIVSLVPIYEEVDELKRGPNDHLRLV
jgi:hypothetical protein